MINSYPSYKPSRMEWLQQVPAHWEERRAKFFFKEVNNKSETGNEELLSVSHITGVTPRSEKNVNMFMAESYVGHKVCEAGDLVINSLWTWMGALGIASQTGIVSSAYGVYRLKHKEAFDSKYLDLLLRITGYKGEYLCRSTGVWTSRLGLNTEDFYDIPIVCPLLEEQKEIVVYLNSKLADIDHYIAEKERLIELLQEQKTALINQAVTRGLNPLARMKSSGIEWLGEIPEHWEISRLKFLAKINPAKNKSKIKQYLQASVVFLPMENISEDGNIDQSQKKHFDEVSQGFTYFEREDVIVAKITPCFENGKGAWLNTLETEIGFGTTELIVLRATPRIYPEFLYWVTRTGFFRKQGVEFMTGSAGQQRVPSSFIENFLVAFPSIDEQKSIVAALKIELGTVDFVASNAYQEIALIQEYRTALIAEAVTGKIDVRTIHE